MFDHYNNDAIMLCLLLMIMGINCWVPLLYVVLGPVAKTIGPFALKSKVHMVISKPTYPHGSKQKHPAVEEGLLQSILVMQYDNQM